MAERQVAELEQGGYRVVGSLEDLRCADSAFAESGTKPTEREVAAASVTALASMLAARGTAEAERRTGRIGAGRDGLTGAAAAAARVPDARGGCHRARRIKAAGQPDSIAADPARPYGRFIMARLCQTDGLTEDQQEILKAVRRFVDEKILPVATELEHADEYPQEIIDGLKELGIFGLMIPEEYDGLGESLLTYALCVEEIARGWMSVSGVINTHFIVAYMLMKHGTDEQKQKYLPRMATGEVRGSFSMSEPALGSDVSAIKTKAVKDADERLHDRRPEDVADQRRHVQPDRAAGEDRRGLPTRSTRT